MIRNVQVPKTEKEARRSIQSKILTSEKLQSRQKQVVDDDESIDEVINCLRDTTNEI